ncbi:unnamed protein product [Boreogadus saida]
MDEPGIPNQPAPVHRSLLFSRYLPDYPLPDLRLPEYSSIAKPPPARLSPRYQTPACLITRPSPSPHQHDFPPGSRPPPA